jgi:hypothetical protein
MWCSQWNENWQGETEVLRENLSQHHFTHHKSHMTGLILEPGSPRWEAGDKPTELWHGPHTTLLLYTNLKCMSIFWDVMSCTPWKFSDVSEERTASNIRLKA